MPADLRNRGDRFFLGVELDDTAQAPQATGSAPEQPYRDLLLADFQLEHESTWRTLDAAAAQRDLVTRFNGGLIVFIGVLLPVLIGNIGVEGSLVVGVLILDIALVFLLFLSFYNLMGVQELRMLQIKQDASRQYSRLALAGGPGRTYFDIQSSKVRPLREQHDPMALVVTMTRHFFFADVFAGGMLATTSVGGFVLYASKGFGSLRPSLPWPPVILVAAALIVASLATHLARLWIDRKIHCSEEAASKDIAATYRKLGVLRD